MPMLSFRRTSSACLFALALTLTTAASSQTLARPGWAGSGMSLEPWWLHSVVYQMDPHGFGEAGDLKSAVKHLDYLQMLGVDIVSVAGFQPKQADQSDPVKRFESVDPAIGSVEDLDDLVREASRDNMRVVVEIDPQQVTEPAAIASVARFWLGRGVAGINLTTADPANNKLDPQKRADQLHALRDAVRSFPGQRILLGELATGDGPRRGEGAQLMLDPSVAVVDKLDAAALRTALQHAQTPVEGATPLIATDGYGLARSVSRLGDAESAKVVAAMLLATHANPRLYFGQEIGLAGEKMAWGTPVDPNEKKPVKVAAPTGPEVAAEDADPASVLGWYRRLIELHHGNAMLRSGNNTFLNHDAENALVWIAKKDPVTPISPVVFVICNLSSKPLKLSLVDDVKNLHLRGTFLRTVIRSDNGMGGMGLSNITLPPYGVYIGQLKL